MKLTQKQEKFVLHYHQHGNAYQAYLHAYDAENMKRETIDSRASKLLKEYKISTRLSELRKDAQQIAQYGVKEAIAELDLAIKEALVKNAKTMQSQPSVIVSAVAAKARLLGLEAPLKQEIKHEGLPVIKINLNGD